MIASLIDTITKGKPKVIGIDILFTEKENEEADHRLAEAFRRTGNVVLATGFIVPTEQMQVHSTEHLYPEVPDFLWDSAFMEVSAQEGINWKQWTVKADLPLLPLEDLSRSSVLGHVYTHPDMDGVTRWEILPLYFSGDVYPHFSLEVARIALGISKKEMIYYGGLGIQLGNKFIPTDLSGRVIINYRGKEGKYRYISALDVLQHKVPSAFFSNKIVLIGTTALGTYDQKVTPFSANMPGVEKNATVVDNILTTGFLRKSPGIVELAVILITGLSFGFMLPRMKAFSSAVLAVSFMTFYISLACYLLIAKNLWINLFYPVSNMFTIFSIQTIYRFVFEERKAKEIRQIFSSYVSPKIVKEIIDNPQKAGLGGERREATILFSDIIGFTSLSERREPEEVVSLLNEYFQEMADIIFRWDGTLDKFVGDEIMAVWGAPLEQPNHAELALRCALEMSRRLNELREKWQSRGSDVLEAGIGINSGEVLIGNIGAPGKKMDYTAIGDHVNLAARVEKLTRQYGAKILTTENTVNIIRLKDQESLAGIEFREVASVKVKGKEREVTLFEVTER